MHDAAMHRLHGMQRMMLQCTGLSAGTCSSAGTRTWLCEDQEAMNVFRWRVQTLPSDRIRAGEVAMALPWSNDGGLGLDA